MKAFLALWGALFVAIAVSVLVYNLSNHAALPAISGFNIFGNVSFSAALATLIWWIREDNPVFSRRTLIGAIAFILSCVGIVVIGLFQLYDARIIGVLLTSPIGTIGSYPAGPDAPLVDGARLWAFSLAAPIGVGLILGLGLRRILPRSRPTGNKPGVDASKP
ncbi:MAG TPA: hypothetical protein VGW40_05450 [Allosphingosinicella sp.]|nr:hypothetical protein [Allosphingosinicella sp.]